MAWNEGKLWSMSIAFVVGFVLFFYGTIFCWDCSKTSIGCSYASQFGMSAISYCIPMTVCGLIILLIGCWFGIFANLTDDEDDKNKEVD